MRTPHVAFIHTSPASIAPLMRYYSEAEPDWTITNLLDDAILRSFKEADTAAAESGLRSLVDRAHQHHGARAVLISCSAAGSDMLGRLQAGAPVPLIKIDAPMAEAAVARASRIGVLVTFAPTTQPTIELLSEQARRAAREVEIVPWLCEGAYEALLRGDSQGHDRMLMHGAEALCASGAEVLVLAQVSMTHMRAPLETELGVPVLSSLETSHSALRKVVG